MLRKAAKLSTNHVRAKRRAIKWASPEEHIKMDILKDFPIVTPVLSGLLGAIFTQCAGWMRESWSLKKTRRFAAIRVALTLEKFSSDCASSVEALTDYLENQGAFGDGRLGLPKYRTPSDEDYRALHLEQLNDALSFPLEVEGSNRIISYMQAIDDNTAQDEHYFENARRGLQAWTLARTIRGLANAEPSRLGDQHIAHLQKLDQQRIAREIKRARELAAYRENA
jgi:hypothetical protein